MATTMRLYDLATALEEVDAWLEEHGDELEAMGGEIPPELVAKLDEIEEAFDEKVEKVGLLMRTLEAKAEVGKREAKRLSDVAKTYENRAVWLKSYLLEQMQRTGRVKVEGPYLKVFVQKNSAIGLRPLDPSNPPARYRLVRVIESMSDTAWKRIQDACEVLGMAAPRTEVEFDRERALNELKEAEKIPPDAGRYEIDGMLVERGVHLRTK